MTFIKGPFMKFSAKFHNVHELLPNKPCIYFSEVSPQGLHNKNNSPFKVSLGRFLAIYLKITFILSIFGAVILFFFGVKQSEKLLLE